MGYSRRLILERRRAEGPPVAAGIRGPLFKHEKHTRRTAHLFAKLRLDLLKQGATPRNK